ncbi:carbon-nitrogen hydrolase family protein [Micromonospora sp. WMMD1102]|uniref:carbon-nitrogen hydrolase family protein n=1 Tax=Micromonospora sp. WMMD1102 TaxID=3016105 RepID=UPI002414F5B9|nr:carbon-nitrogen hydrolase family protein [Micromonospora sp. WMMD1102]MDG4789663.1 carbon-nitrogen hydrolase family protein [Micromonospora sp. WMMD1102]
MRDPLVLAVAQPRCLAHDVVANADAHAEAVRAAGARVLVFPEMSLTGYEFDAAPVDPGDSRLAPVVTACAETGTLALVGAPVAGERGRRHIGVLAVDGDGARVAYRKMFLGGSEPAHFAPGDGPAVVEVAGWRLGLAVCKDTGIPEHAAGTASLGIDAYLAGALDHAAEWGVQAERALRTAAAHRVWVATASFAGATGGGFTHAAGRSRIWAPDGRVVAEAGPEPDEVVRATLA